MGITQECCNSSRTNPGSNTQRNNGYTTSHQKKQTLEQDKQDKWNSAEKQGRTHKWGSLMSPNK